MMPAPTTRLGTAESAADHIQWARATGLSPRDAAAAIGWMVPHSAEWGMVTALYSAELAKVLDSSGKRREPETTKAGCLNIRPAAIGSDPVVSTAGEAAADVVRNSVKDRSRSPNCQPAEFAGTGFYGLSAGGFTRSNWRSA